jgi:hypothetical protein
MPRWPDDARKIDRPCPMVLRLAVCGVLIAHGFPAAAQTRAEPAARPPLAIPMLAPSSLALDRDGDGDGDRGRVRDAQFMPQMPPMMAPRVGGSQGSMGGGMAMVMTGDTMGEMLTGACAAGLFIGGIAAAAAMAPAAPLSASAVASAAGIGCGLAVAATAAGMAGMMGWRAAYDRLK